MIITRTPFRVSFFGGGTDFPEWYKYNSGSVISTTIRNYSFIISRKLFKTLEVFIKPALAVLLPNKKVMSVVLDLGANIECNEKNLIDFA